MKIKLNREETLNDKHNNVNKTDNRDLVDMLCWFGCEENIQFFENGALEHFNDLSDERKNILKGIGKFEVPMVCDIYRMHFDIINN